ncbi:hypothetical protein [Phaeobacter inhibens]|uniref:hypothetical protein n=1 Tax=Phaeobacter inhibens TaxID=221822 RepID=UPI0020C7EED7|nr:hypothetical protein [Phaeobacter inhibens]
MLEPPAGQPFGQRLARHRLFFEMPPQDGNVAQIGLPADVEQVTHQGDCTDHRVDADIANHPRKRAG